MGGAAVAAIPARDGDVHVCYSQKTGKVELVDTQRDRFNCPRDWDGFTIDSEPTQLVSPDGRFRAKVTNSDATLTGPSGRVEISPTRIEIQGNGSVDIRASGSLDLRGSRVNVEETGP
jgi:hypothetical protein